jgi:putative methionine-R-sulfoxide reductase with GAF domain
MRLFKPLIFTLFTLLIVLFIISIILFYKLSILQNILLSNGINVSDFNSIVQGNFKLFYILLSIISGIGIISLIFFILNELSKKLNIFSFKNKSSSSDFDNSSEKKKSINTDEEKDKLFQLYQIKIENLINKFNEIFQKKGDISIIAKKILKEYADLFQIVQGEIYMIRDNKIKLLETYAYYVPEGKIIEFEIGDGLIGQVAKEMQPLRLDNIPENYIVVASGLGKASPSNLIIFPILFDNNLIGIIELASFTKFSKYDQELCMKSSIVLGKYFSQNISQKHQENDES